MSIRSDIPQIAALREQVESRFGKRLSVHADFMALVAEIEMVQRQHISETTLERVWGYSTRGYDRVSLRTLDVLSLYAQGVDWQQFCASLPQKWGQESEIYNVEQILSSQLTEGDRLEIGWLPDRLCVVRYMGANRFVAEHCENSKMQCGDSFSCLQFVLGKELVMSNFTSPVNPTAEPLNYAVGSLNGLTTLRHLK